MKIKLDLYIFIYVYYKQNNLLGETGYGKI